MSQKEEIKRANCYSCNKQCGLLVRVVNGKVVNIDVDPNYMGGGPVAGKGVVGEVVRFVCEKLKYGALLEQIDHPDRINFPMKRVGERGEGKWKQISWDQAFNEIAGKLKQIKEEYGPEALILLTGTGHGHTSETGERFCNLFGSPNYLFLGKDCGGSEFPIECAMYGYDSFMSPITKETKCIILWGFNPAESFPQYWIFMLAAKREGAKIIAVDPQLSESAQYADLFLQIRPGSDGALALGMLNVIINEGLYDKKFVEEWTNAPFLIRKDTKKLLVEKDLQNGGSPINFVVWDIVSNAPSIWDSEVRKFKKSGTKSAMEGSYSIRLSDGTQVECSTVWDLLRKRVNELSLEKVSELTWIPKEKIVEAARIFANSKNALIPWGVATNQIGGGAGQAINHYKCVLRSITGNIDVRGGTYLRSQLPINWIEMVGYDNLLIHPDRKRDNVSAHIKPVGSCRAHKLYKEAMKRAYPKGYACAPYLVMASPGMFWNAILTGEPYPIKAVIIQGESPLTSLSNGRKIYKAFKSNNLDLLVVNDIFWNPNAELADYVLPVSSWIERPSLALSEGLANQIAGGERAIKPMYERRDDYQIMREIGMRLGQRWPETLEKYYDEMLEPLGMTFSELVSKPDRTYHGEKLPPLEYEKHLKRGFGTRSGRVELYSSIFETLGCDPLPSYEEPPWSPFSTPSLYQLYPLVLSGGFRFRAFQWSEHRQLKSVRKIHPWPLVYIHPETARNLNINDGDWVYIETPLGRVRQKASITPAIHPLVVNADSHWWFPEEPGEEPFLHGVFTSNINSITPSDPEFCDWAGNLPFRGNLCKVYKANQYIQ